MPPASAMPHVGILAHSTEGAALCFVSLCEQAGQRIGEYDHPPVTMDCAPLAWSMPYYDTGDLHAVRVIMSDSLGRLKSAGCDYFVCPDNTVHQALELAGPPLPLPGIHIAEVVAVRALGCGYRKVAVLGTRYLMESRVYPDALNRQGIAWAVPTEADRGAVHRIIFDELLHGIVTHESADRLRRVIDQMAAEGCDAVALACTELPMIVTSEVSTLPLLDSTRLLATAALDAALSDALPTWRGGPVS